MKWVGVTAGFVIVPVTFAVKYLERTQGIDTEFKEDRNRLYVLGIVCVLLLLAYLDRASAPTILFNAIHASIGATAVAGAVNLKTKISLHTAVVAGTATVTYFVNPFAGIALGIAAVLVGWSRIRLDHHTVQQVILGGVTASTAVALVFTVAPV